MRHRYATTIPVFFLCALLHTAQPQWAGQPRAFEIADFYRSISPGSPAVDPEGKHVVFSVRRYDFEGKKTWSELWMMNPDGSGLRQRTSAGHNDTSPAFSPDGKRIVFVSDRSGDKAQLFVLPAEGGEPRQLTNLPAGVAAPRWSPDGRWIAVTSAVYPECGSDAECNRRISKGLEGKLQAHMADALLYRHWDSWRDGAYNHILLIDANDGKAVKDLTPGAWDSPTFSLDGAIHYDFSPDGRELCFVSNHDPNPAASTNADLWTIAVDGDPARTQPVNITSANRGWDGQPVYSPDGHYIAYRSQEIPGYESALFRLALFDRRTGSTRYLTGEPGWDNWVTSLAWSSDSQTILFQGEFQGRTPIYRFSLATQKIEKILTDGTIDDWILLPPGGSLIYTRRKIDRPAEILRADIASGKQHRLTHFNDRLTSEVDFRPAEELWVPGAGDYKVHVFVIKPHDFDPARKYPLILNVHGGPQSQWTDGYRGDWQVYPGAGYVVAFANPTGSTGYGQKFTDAIRKDWGGRVFQDLMLVTDALEKLPYVDKDRMGAMGWSYGGYMVMWFEGHTRRFKANASMMGLYNLTAMYGSTEELWFPEWDMGGAPWESDLYRKWSPSEYVRNFATPCLVITGEKDFRVPYTQSLEFFTALQKMQVPSRLIVFENAGHWPGWYEMAFYYNAHLDWFHRWLGGGAAPYAPEKFLRNQVP